MSSDRFSELPQQHGEEGSMTEQRRYRITIPIIIACAIAPISHAVGAIGSTASPLIINAWNQPLYIPVNNNAAETADAPDTS